jgi:hypothetical protein
MVRLKLGAETRSVYSCLEAETQEKILIQAYTKPFEYEFNKIILN